MNAKEQPLGNLAKRLASFPVASRREFLERLTRGDAELQPHSNATLATEFGQTNDSSGPQHEKVLTKALLEGENSGSASLHKAKIQRFYDAISGQLNASGHGQYAL